MKIIKKIKRFLGLELPHLLEEEEEARKVINKSLDQQINELANIPLLKATDFSNVITPKEVIKDIEKNITEYFGKKVGYDR